VDGDSGGGGGGGGSDGVGMNTPAPQYRGGNQSTCFASMRSFFKRESPGRKSLSISTLALRA